MQRKTRWNTSTVGREARIERERLLVVRDEYSLHGIALTGAGLVLTVTGGLGGELTRVELTAAGALIFRGTMGLICSVPTPQRLIDFEGAILQELGPERGSGAAGDQDESREGGRDPPAGRSGRLSSHGPDRFRSRTPLAPAAPRRATEGS